MEPPSKARSVVSLLSRRLEPCIVLRGKWIKDAGFNIGQKVTVTVESNALHITHSPELIES